MRKTLHKIAALLLVAVIASVSSCIVASGYDIYSYNSYSKLNNVTLLRNDSQAFLVGSNGCNVMIDAVYPHSYGINLSLDNDAKAFTLCGNTMIIICDTDDYYQNHVVLYDIESDTFTSFYVTADTEYLSTHIAYADGYVYLAQENGTVNVYSQKGTHISTLGIDGYITCLITDFDQRMYALSGNGMYKLTPYESTRISYDNFAADAQFISSDVFVDELNDFYSTDSSSVTQIINLGTASYTPSGSIYNGYAITYDADTIYATDLSDNIAKKKLTLSSNIIGLYSFDDIMVTMTHNNLAVNISLIPFSELKNIPQKNNNSDNKASDNEGSGTYVSEISSDVYTVDFDNMEITGISPSTTVAQFKENMNYDGYSVEFYRYNKDEVLKSGNIGTATLAIFSNDKYIFKFELSVTGDLTGEGNVNSRDKNAMFDYLLDDLSFTGVFVDSSDLNDSDDISVVDLILLLRMIESQK